MQQIKYKVTGAFGTRLEGEIVTAYLLNVDEDSGVGLCFHPATGKYECGSFEFVKPARAAGQWMSAFGEDVYTNVGNISLSFKEYLNERIARSRRQNRRNRKTSKRR